MLVSPSLLLKAAEDAGMKVPELNEDEEFFPEEYPHFQVFCNAQLGRAMTSWNEHWENAKIIVKIPDEKIRTVTVEDLIKLGVVGL